MPHNSVPEFKTASLLPVARMVPLLIAVLLAGSVFFYKERMLFIDAPHILFRIINDGHLMISDFRYGSFVTQIFPLFGSFLHLPLKCLMVLYSASFYLFYLMVALLLVYKYKNYGLALLFGLYLTLFVSGTYYWPNNEVHQGIGWLMLALAANYYIAEKQRPFILSLVVFIGSCYLAIWTHPLVMLVAVYLWFFLMMGQFWPYSRLQSVLYSVVLLGLSFLKFNQGRQHGYDSTKIEVVTGLHIATASTIFSSPQFHFFVHNCLTNYWLFLLLFIAGIAGMLAQKKFLPLLWTLLFAGGYLTLVCITFWDANANRFYIESEYMPLSIIGTAPFVYFVLPRLRSRVGATIISLVFLVRLVYICDAHAAFTNRVAILNSINNKMKEKNLTKIIIPEPVPGIDSALIMNWGAPVESLLLSGIKGDNPQRSFIFAVPGDANAYAKIGSDTLIGCWDLRPQSKINQFYFHTDTSVKYRQISYSTLMD